jgi:hypothetical protein
LTFEDVTLNFLGNNTLLGTFNALTSIVALILRGCLLNGFGKNIRIQMLNILNIGKSGIRWRRNWKKPLQR